MPGSYPAHNQPPSKVYNVGKTGDKHNRVNTGEMLQGSMSTFHRWFSSSGKWKRPLAISAAVTFLYSISVFGYSLLPFSNVSISGSPWHVLTFSMGSGLVTIGFPVYLWFRYEIRSPVALLIGILVFWHVLVYIPPIGSGQGDSPGFLFVFVGAPLYLLMYSILAAVEYWLRGRNFSQASTVG